MKVTVASRLSRLTSVLLTPGTLPSAFFTVIGQAAHIDTRNGIVEGKVLRIDPAVQNGTVQVDVELVGDLPAGARPDLSVDGTIELERLVDALFVGRPAFGQADSEVRLFKLDADDVAILDIHILRAGVLAGFFDAELTVERHYRELEDQFLAFSAGLGVRASELDALMWYEMMASRNSVAQILSAMPESAFKARHAPSRPPANPERPHARQLALIR